MFFIPEAALELCQLNISQLSPDILKFRTKREDYQDNPFTLTILWFLAAFYLYLMQARVDWVQIIFGTQVIKKKTAGSARVSRLSFRFL